MIDGSKDNTEKAIQDIGFPSSKLKILFHENQGRAKTRNKGINHTNGDILFFLDDDMRISENCLEQHGQHYFSFPDSILLGKVVLDTQLFTKDFDFYIHSLYSKWEIGRNKKTQVTYENFKFTSAHLSIPKKLLLQLGGFDDRLNDAEDYDLGMRALEAGIDIYYDPSIIAYHDDFPTCTQYIKRQIEYKKSHQRLKQLGIKYVTDLFPPVMAPQNILKKIATRLFSSRYWVTCIDNERLSFLPQKIRFKLYSIVVYSHTLKGLGLI